MPSPPFEPPPVYAILLNHASSISRNTNIQDTHTAMKIISLNEAAENLQKYGKLCHRDPILVTMKGLPLFKMVGYKENEDPVIDALLKAKPDYQKRDIGPKKSARMVTKGVMAELNARKRKDQREEKLK